MAAYLLKRLLLIIPTMLGIMTISFIIIQFAPGGPVERVIAQLTGTDVGATSRIGGSGSDGLTSGGRSMSGQSGTDAAASRYRGAQGLDPEFIKQLERQFGFDRPAHERFFLMMKNYLMFDFGKSYFRDVSVIQLIKEKLPVSISLGVWMMLLTYLIAIPLGIRKAVRDGERFDTWTSGVLVVGYAVPGFLFAVLLLVLFAGGSFFQWFPSRGLTSENWSQLSPLGKVTDYFWHLTLPLIAMALSTFTTKAFLTKNSFLDEIRKQYVMTARAKGLSESPGALRPRLPQRHAAHHCRLPRRLHRRVLLGRAADRDHLLARRPGAARASSSILNRDYPVVFATLYILSLIGLLVNLLSDFLYTLVDPRIDFETREV